MITAQQAIDEARELTERVPDEVRTDIQISFLAYRIELLSARLYYAEKKLHSAIAAS